jgi:hypothetical protein
VLEERNKQVTTKMKVKTDMGIRSETVLQLGVVEPVAHALLIRMAQNRPGLIESCAILRWFDESTLAEFLEVDDPKAIMAELAIKSFVEPRNYGISFHDFVRGMICKDIADQSPIYYKNLHKRAAEYCRRRAAESPYWMRQRWIIELSYHLIRANEDEGISLLRSIVSFGNALSQHDFATALLETTNEVSLRNDNRALVEHWESSLKSHDREN